MPLEGLRQSLVRQRHGMATTALTRRKTVGRRGDAAPRTAVASSVGCVSCVREGVRAFVVCLCVLSDVDV